MVERLILVDGYNCILRSPRLRPGPNRTLRDSRDMLVNLLSWMMGANDARFIVVFDGAEGGRDEPEGRVQVLYSRPPETADDVIRRIVEKRVGGDEEITVVTSDIEVARHARGAGAEVSLADLFIASALGSTGEPRSDKPGENAEPEDKPPSLSKKELEEWAEIFARKRSPGGEAPEDPEN